jgi:predicted DNA-binding mobile mystery protein A
MQNPPLTAQSRHSLDARFAALKPVARFRSPVRGWIKAVREALGMTSAQLAKRLQVKQPTVIAFEQSELKGTIQLNTLRRVAEAMNCTLVYALVPNDSLETTIREQARKVAEGRMQSVEHSMLLENQGLPRKEFEARVNALAQGMKPRTLWDET